MSKYPFIKQNGLKDCGATCLAMIIKYYNGYVGFEKLRLLTKTTKYGVNAYNLCEGAKEVGFEAYGLRCTLENIVSDEIVFPCIAHVKINNYQHYIVIYKINYKKKQIVIADPAVGLKKISFVEFESIWDGVIINLFPNRKIPIERKNTSFQLFLNIIKCYPKLLLNIFLYSIMTIIFSCITSFYFKTLIDNLNTSKNYLLFIFIIFLIINLFKQINSFLRNKLIIEFNKKIDMMLSKNIYDKIIDLPYQYYRNRTTGEMVSRFNDLSLVKDMISKTLFTILIDVPLLIISFILLFMIDIHLSFILLFLTLLYSLIVLLFQPYIDNYIEKIQQEKSYSSSLMVESISGFETVKNLSAGHHFKTLFKEKYYKLVTMINSFDKALNIKQLFNEFIFEIGILVILFIGVLKIVDNQLTISSLIMFYTLINYYVDSVKNLFNFDISYRQSRISLKRILELFFDYQDNGIVRILKDGVIDYHNLSFSYNNTSLVLKNINLVINQGEKVLITGSSGSGKSTLLKLLMRYYSINNNQIFIDDIDLNFYKEDVLRKNIIYISQNEILFSDSIINNLLLGKEEDISGVIELCEINQILNKRNLNFNYIVEENGFNFSGGEKQRIMLARALLKNFKILLIDEGLSQMDVNLERRILKKLFNKYKNETIIVVSHRMDNADLYSRNIQMEKGRIIKDVCKTK